MKNFKKLINLIHCFIPEYNGSDQIWKFYFKIGRRWELLGIVEYQGVHYFSGNNFDSFSVGAKPEERRQEAPPTPEIVERVPLWIKLLESIYTQVKKDPALYHRTLLRVLSPSLREGVIARRFVHQLIPEYMRFDQELAKKDELKQVIHLLRTPLLNPEPIQKMTAGLYFEYCRVAYLANPKTFGEGFNSKASGLKLYKTYADGRDEGLTSLPLDSEEAFQKWYESGRGGGHPWEIYRGGNSTHINLYITKESYRPGWKIGLTAFSSTRLAETCRIALALQKAELTFELSYRESYLKRLLAEDWVGIVPEHYGIKYAWQGFPKEWDVADCIHFSWFKDERDGKTLLPLRVIKGLVTWLPIRPIYAGKSGKHSASDETI